MNITALTNLLSRKFRGASIDDVQGVTNYTLFDEAAKNLLSKIDPFETVRHSEVDVFDGIYDYASPSDLKGKKILDIRPQVNRASYDNASQTFTEDFDRDKEEQKFSVEFDEGTKFIRYRNSVGRSITVTETTDDNWTATSGVTNIVEDTILYVEDGMSLRFDVASGSNLLTWDGDSVIDLSDHTNKSTFFLWVYYPDSSLITSLTIRVGSSASAYYEMTGSIHFGSIRNGWNLYKFSWNGATETGTTLEASTDYVRLALVTTSADTDIRIGRLSSKLPSPHEFVYYSNCLFRPVSGSTWLTLPTVVTDIVNLDIEAEPLFINECCVLIADDLQQYDESEKFRIKLDGTGEELGMYDCYKRDKPSEAIRPQTTYYKIRGIRK